MKKAMFKHFLLSLLISTQLYVSAHAKRIEAENVSIFQEKEFTLHIASYQEGFLILTMLKGKSDSLQEIFLNNDCVNYSHDFEENENFFLHFYPDFFIYSTTDSQTIFTEDP